MTGWSRHPQMALMYGNSHCNIAATWASNGTQGCFSTRDPLLAHPITANLGDSGDYSLVLMDLFGAEITEAPLNKRGWVVQERCLSPRQLMFAKNQVYWECAELVASEQCPGGIYADEALRSRLEQTNNTPRLNFGDEFQNRRAWCRLVESYSACRLTRSSDKMIALASLAREMGENISDIYLAGHWKRDLLHQLLWDTAGKFPMGGSDEYHAPSWSWAGHEGSVVADPGYGNLKDPPTILTDILDVHIESKDPLSRHSFMSGVLRARGVTASTGRLLLTKNVDVNMQLD